MAQLGSSYAPGAKWYTSGRSLRLIRCLRGLSALSSVILFSMQLVVYEDSEYAWPGGVDSRDGSWQ